MFAAIRSDYMPKISRKEWFFLLSNKVHTESPCVWTYGKVLQTRRLITRLLPFLVSFVRGNHPQLQRAQSEGHFANFLCLSLPQNKSTSLQFCVLSPDASDLLYSFHRVHIWFPPQLALEKQKFEQKFDFQSHYSFKWCLEFGKTHTCY